MSSELVVMAKLVEIVSDFHLGAEIAQHIADYHIRQHNLRDKVQVISSGTLLHIPDDGWNYDIVCYVFDHGGNLSQEMRRPDKYRYNNELSYQTAMNNHAKKLHGALLGLNVANGLRLHTMLRTPLSYTPTQTQPRDDVSFVLGLRPEHVAQVQKLYQGHIAVPPIVSLLDYVPGTPSLPALEAKLIVLVGPEYIRILQDAIPHVVDRFVREHCPSP